MKQNIKTTLLTTMSIMTLALTGCGDSTETTDANENTQQEVQADETQVEGDAESTAYEYTDTEGRTLTFEELPNEVVVTYMPIWEAVLMLGVEPVGAPGVDYYAGFWGPFIESGVDFDAVTDVGLQEVNFEVLATLNPEVTITMGTDNLDKFEAVGQTAVFDMDIRNDWRAALEETGALLGRSDVAEDVIAEVDVTIAHGREALSDTEETTILISLMGDKLYYLYREELYDKETGLGLNIPANFDVNQRSDRDELPLETVVGMNPDNLFINVFPDNQANFEELQSNPLWQSLDAVKNGNVHVINGPGHSKSAMSTIYTIEFILEALGK